MDSQIASLESTYYVLDNIIILYKVSWTISLSSNSRHLIQTYIVLKTPPTKYCNNLRVSLIIKKLKLNHISALMGYNFSRVAIFSIRHQSADLRWYLG